MKKLLLLVLASLVTGCAHNPENVTKLTELEEVFEFNIIDTDIAQKRSHDFISDVYKRQPKASFDIRYQPDASEFVDTLTTHMKHIGIHPDRINLSIESGESNKQISIVSSYIHIQDKNCGTMYFAKSNRYPFGCVVEYNQTKMLASPEKLKR
ncbi:hypothetical protein L3Q72_16975 [Vibrio sp. JC009]|uniref:hypothetical protein n=1 Tax=Vibrio sp. JC009 TaxID=2912314 RepID=UPI0023B0556E|nr:hypothetical protein [Vibrio sp. JC009]WED24567.1 hypothetical protein L3Q72_16975 [Vibrio sp. JC009]